MHQLAEIAAASSIASLVVDIILFPLDTLKTWSQQKNNFHGFFFQKKKNIFYKNKYPVNVYYNHGICFRYLYHGLAGMAVGSIPSSLIFFIIYETTYSKMYNKFFKKAGKNTLEKDNCTSEELSNSPLSNKSRNSRNDFSIFYSTIAACLGEFAACSVRVPTELIKQRTQAGQYRSSWEALCYIFRGRIGGFYQGYTSTLIRDVPFCAIQFPLWETLKKKIGNIYSPCNETIPSDVSITSNKSWLSSAFIQSAVSGSIAGGISAAMTTPLDVIKTRIMLSKIKHSWISCMYKIIKEEGAHALFKGITFRVGWTSLGGALFLGTYDGIHQLIHSL